MKNKFIAFWKYDLYPYLLNGEINEKEMPKLWKNRLCYYIDSYQGYYAPEFILPIKQGKELASRISVLKTQKRAKEEEIHKDFVEKLNSLFREFEIEYKK